jgi:hypothetical protein
MVVPTPTVAVEACSVVEVGRVLAPKSRETPGFWANGPGARFDCQAVVTDIEVEVEARAAEAVVDASHSARAVSVSVMAPEDGEREADQPIDDSGWTGRSRSRGC